MSAIQRSKLLFTAAQIVPCDRCVNGKKTCTVDSRGRCQSCITINGAYSLNTRYYNNAESMKCKDAGAWALVWHRWVEGLKQKGEPYPDAPILHRTKRAFCRDLNTWDGHRDEVHWSLVEWQKRRTAAKAQGRRLPALPAQPGSAKAGRAQEARDQAEKVALAQANGSGSRQQGDGKPAGKRQRL